MIPMGSQAYNPKIRPFLRSSLIDTLMSISIALQLQLGMFLYAGHSVQFIFNFYNDPIFRSREACGVPFSCCKPQAGEFVKNIQCGYDVRKETYVSIEFVL